MTKSAASRRKDHAGTGGGPGFAIPLPGDLYGSVERLAAITGLTPEAFVAEAVAQKVAFHEREARFAELRDRGASPKDVAAALDVLSREGGRPPNEDDRLD